MFKVKVIVPFEDLKEKTYRKIDDVFVVDKKRLNQLLKNKLGMSFVEVIEEFDKPTEETKEVRVIVKKEIEKDDKRVQRKQGN